MSVPHFLLFRQANIIIRVGTAHHFLYGAMNRHDSEGSSEWIMSAMEVFCAPAFTSPSRVDVAQTVSSRIITYSPHLFFGFTEFIGSTLLSLAE